MKTDGFTEESAECNSLEQFTRDLAAEASSGKLDPVVGRDDEIHSLIKILARRKKNNPVLIGDPGVGKTAAVEGLAQKIASGEVPLTLKEKRILSLDMGALLAGTTTLNESAAELRMEIDSVPREIDQAEKAIIRLEIEKEAVKKENDAAKRVAPINLKLTELTSRRNSLKAHWLREQKAVRTVQNLKKRIEKLKYEADKAERELEYEQGGQLTETVRRKPYQVILLNEIEKAHHDVTNILLQVFDCGGLTDGQGRTIDFRSTVCLLTSNIGSELFYSSDTGGFESIKIRVLEQLNDFFKPELLNRLDEIIVFHSLTPVHLKEIITIRLNDLKSRMNDARNMHVRWTDKTLEFLYEKGYDPAFGARPVNRAIRRYIEDPMAIKFLKGDIMKEDTVIIDVDETGNLLFDIIRAESQDAA